MTSTEFLFDRSIVVGSPLLTGADRPPRVLANGEIIDLGGRKVRYIDTFQSKVKRRKPSEKRATLGL